MAILRNRSSEYPGNIAWAQWEPEGGRNSFWQWKNIKLACWQPTHTKTAVELIYYFLSLLLLFELHIFKFCVKASFSLLLILLGPNVSWPCSDERLLDKSQDRSRELHNIPAYQNIKCSPGPSSLASDHCHSPYSEDWDTGVCWDAMFMLTSRPLNVGQQAMQCC